MTDKVTITGMDKLLWNLTNLEDHFGKEIKSALVAGGLLVETQAKQNVRDLSSGRQVTRYRNGGKSYKHIAASAGESPNTDTGRLVSSISTEIDGSSVFVGTSLEYAEALEFGTKKMKARPFLHKALITKQSKINDLIANAIKEAISASTN